MYINYITCYIKQGIFYPDQIFIYFAFHIDEKILVERKAILILLHFILKLKDNVDKLLTQFSKHLVGIRFAFYGPINLRNKKLSISVVSYFSSNFFLQFSC